MQLFSLFSAVLQEAGRHLPPAGIVLDQVPKSHLSITLRKVNTTFQSTRPHHLEHAWKEGALSSLPSLAFRVFNHTFPKDHPDH